MDKGVSAMSDAKKMQNEIKLPRTAKGKRPQYFSDPAIDKLLAIVVTLVGEVSVLRDRLDSVERLIEKHDVFDQKDVEEFSPTEEEVQARNLMRQQYLDRVFRVVQYELEEMSGGREAHLDRIIADFTEGKF